MNWSKWFAPPKQKPEGAKLRYEHEGKTPSRVKYDDEWYDVESFIDTTYNGRIYFTYDGERIYENYVEDMEFDDDEEEEEE